MLTLAGSRFIYHQESVRWNPTECLGSFKSLGFWDENVFSALKNNTIQSDRNSPDKWAEYRTEGKCGDLEDLKPAGASQVVQVVKTPPASAGDLRVVGSIPESVRSPGEGHRNPLQYSCLESPMDREAWQVSVHRVSKSWKWLKQVSMHAKQPGMIREAFLEDWYLRWVSRIWGLAKV